VSQFEKATVPTMQSVIRAIYPV